ncbi:MAG: nucleotidyl transferase AbiEii/AbiGii toxin family protein [Symploca sp. SIO1B1]|nr:nucleotidyl transferase AbiEii/AbiGii toxin family protein [Symploca sp. SIO1C2]NER93290.1 nucleotidyl transferase AbiEii/AbiGii toxin family protein [Symploca sp. SIO1B1]
MLGTDILSFQEFMTKESLPLATIQAAVFEFLRERDDVVVFGAQAVNAYVGEPRMTQDIDLMSIRAQELVEELREYLRERFYLAARVREVKGGKGYRLYQVQKSGNRHLIDIRQVEKLPLAQPIEQVLVMAPAELIASKVISYYQRRGKPKSGTDWRDLAMLLLTFPKLKQESSEVLSCLKAAVTNEKILELWREMVKMEIQQEDDDEY